MSGFQQFPPAIRRAWARDDAMADRYARRRPLWSPGQHTDKQHFDGVYGKAYWEAYYSMPAGAR